MSSPLYTIPVHRIDGTSATLAEFKGKALLIVNVASKCGLTPQYTSLQKLYDEKHAAGLEILGFPANNFKEQEPGTNNEIAQFCSLNYGVSFPLFEKISVNGPDRHPIYQALITAHPETEGTEAFRNRLETLGIPTSKAPDVLWNFEKFIVNRHGDVIARFSPDISADDPRVQDAIAKALQD